MEFLDEVFDMWLWCLRWSVLDERLLALYWAFFLTCTVLFFIRFMKEVFR